jgi:hypothetical protein
MPSRESIVIERGLKEGRWRDPRKGALRAPDGAIFIHFHHVKILTRPTLNTERSRPSPHLSAVDVLKT